MGGLRGAGCRRTGYGFRRRLAGGDVMAITYEFEEQSMDTVKSEIAAIYDRNEGRSIRSTISKPVDGWIKVLVVVQDMDGKP